MARNVEAADSVQVAVCSDDRQRCHLRLFDQDGQQFAFVCVTLEFLEQLIEAVHKAHEEAEAEGA